MNNLMIFNTIHYDTKIISLTEPTSFFNETDENEESVTGMYEDESVKWIFNNQRFRNLIIGEFFDNPEQINCYFELTEPFTERNKKPGDIDLLLVDPTRPDLSIAFECKRVKAITIDEETSKVNNVEKVRKGVIQANGYQSLGFHKSYLMIIILDDGRNKKAANTLFNSTDSEDLTRLYNIPWDEPLNKEVGIVFINLNQTTGNHINQNGSIGICVDRRAEPLEQTTSMTNKIKYLL